MTDGKLVVDANFGPELAGHRVGWVRAGELKLEDERMLVHIDVASGVVGTEGAVVSHIEYDDGKKGFTRKSIEGLALASAVGLEAIVGSEIDRSQWSIISSRLQRYGSDRPTSGSILNSGAQYLREGMYEEKTWFTTTKEILEGLETSLDTYGFAKQSAPFYYRLNHMLLHTALRPTDYDQLYLSSGMYDNALADPVMHDQTMDEISKAKANAVLLAEQYTENDALNQLIQDSENPAEIATNFQQARRLAHKKEQTLIDINRFMVEPGAVFMETGAHGVGRSWPYMDAAVSDEQAAFGMELQDLQAGHEGRAVYELHREFDELGHRLEWAIQGLRSLKILARLEERVKDESLRTTIA